MKKKSSLLPQANDISASIASQFGGWKDFSCLLIRYESVRKLSIFRNVLQIFALCHFSRSIEYQILLLLGPMALGLSSITTLFLQTCRNSNSSQSCSRIANTEA